MFLGLLDIKCEAHIARIIMTIVCRSMKEGPHLATLYLLDVAQHMSTPRAHACLEKQEPHWHCGHNHSYHSPCIVHSEFNALCMLVM